MSVIVSLSLATICYLGKCQPALVGAKTPLGEYAMQQRFIRTPGYGGDVLSFKEDGTGIFAIHRVWTLRPAQRREERLASGRTADRRGITGGCINVTPEVYEELVECCSTDTLRIVR